MQTCRMLTLFLQFRPVSPVVRYIVVLYLNECTHPISLRHVVGHDPIFPLQKLQGELPQQMR